MIIDLEFAFDEAVLFVSPQNTFCIGIIIGVSKNNKYQVKHYDHMNNCLTERIHYIDESNLLHLNIEFLMSALYSYEENIKENFEYIVENAGLVGKSCGIKWKGKRNE